MTLETAKKAVDYWIGNLRYKKEHFGLNPKEKSSITYFGGEPMLCYDSVIVPLTKYLEDTYPGEFSLSMTTNGTLLNKERIAFLKEHNISILLSIDGAPATQNANRPCHDSLKESFDLVYPNIKPLLEAFPNTTFRSTIDRHTVQNTFENYVFASFMGFRNIFMMPNGREKWSKEEQEELYNQFKKIYGFMETCFRKDFMPISFSPINNSFERVLKHDLEVLNPRGKNKKRGLYRCGLGTVGGSVGFEGSIYGCQEQPSKDKTNIFYIGNLDDGIDVNLHSRLLEKFTNSVNTRCENEEFCKYCQLKNICEEFNCPSSSWDLFQNFGMDNEIHCLWYQIMFSLSTDTMHVMVNENNETFKRYLNNYCNYTKYFGKEER
jgi:uncharacterized protein